MCSSPLVIEQATYAQLQEYNLGETFEKIPLFSQVLAQVNGRVPLIVEIKSTERIERTCLKVYDLLRNYPGDYCIESMNPLIMGWFAKNEPQIMRGQLATHIPSKGNPLTAISSAALGGMMFNILSKPHFIAYDHRFAQDSHSFSFCKSCGALTVGWTIREQDYEAAIHQYDAIIFEGFLPPIRF